MESLSWNSIVIHTAVGPASHCWTKWHQERLFPFNGHSLQCEHGAMIWIVGDSPACCADWFPCVSMWRSKSRAHRTEWNPQRSPSSATTIRPPGRRNSAIVADTKTHPMQWRKQTLALYSTEDLLEIDRGEPCRRAFHATWQKPITRTWFTIDNREENEVIA